MISTLGFSNSFITVSDADELIGLRLQSAGVSRGWAREELFYVEEHGRIRDKIFTAIYCEIKKPS